MSDERPISPHQPAPRQKVAYRAAPSTMSESVDSSQTHSCDHRLYHTSTAGACRIMRRPSARIGSVGITAPVLTGHLGVHSWLFVAVVGASNVEPRSYEGRYASYVPGPGPWWRGTRLRRPTGTSGKARKS